MSKAWVVLLYSFGEEGRLVVSVKSVQNTDYVLRSISSCQRSSSLSFVHIFYLFRDILGDRPGYFFFGRLILKLDCLDYV